MVKVKHPVPMSTQWAFMEYNDIPSSVDPSNVYLRRLRIIQTPWFGLYLHWINEPDSARHVHDHPWNFWSLVLRGGYSEQVHERFGDRGRIAVRHHWSIHRMRTSQAHRIMNVLPSTLTLVLTGRRTRTWCFWTETGKVPWREYLDIDATDES